MQPRLAHSPLRRSLAGLLVCALLLTQALGLLHRVLHADGPAHGAHERAGIEALFAHEHGSADCQVFDQLSHTDGVGFGIVDRGAMPPMQLRASARPVPVQAAQATGYRARGPPGAA